MFNKEEFVRTTILYNDAIMNRKDTGYAFGIMKLPKDPAVFSIFNVILASCIELTLNTYFILPLIFVIISTEFLKKGRMNSFILDSCVDAELEIEGMSDEDRLELVDSLITEIKGHRTSFMTHTVSSFLSCTSIFLIAYASLRMLII
jgi:hypothetical protein